MLESTGAKFMHKDNPSFRSEAEFEFNGPCTQITSGPFSSQQIRSKAGLWIDLECWRMVVLPLTHM